MIAELHCHTHYSKGSKIKTEGLNSPKEIVEYADKIGLDAIAITDHDQFKGAIEAELAARNLDITVIKGEEISTKQGHLIGLGLSEIVPPGMDVNLAIDSVKSQGGITIAPHPFDLNNKGIKENAEKCDAVEVFNAINLDRLSNFKAMRFAKKKNKPMVAGSDAHWNLMIGHGITRIKTDSTDEEGIIKAIKKGKVEAGGKYIPVPLIQTWSLLRIKNSYQYLQQYIAENYSLPKRALSKRLLYLTKRSPGKIDYFFKGIAYFGLATAMVYSAAKHSRNII